ncbi:MAG: DUF4136 domain-containing protein [Caldimonas sp.]|nr:DUF4136 domain-containing protein [Pseudomonadota bacterium]
MWLSALGLAALAGCASLNSVDSDVSSFSRWPAGRTPATYAFERLPSQQAHPQQAQVLEDAARRAVEGAGFAPVAEGASPDVTIQLGARVAELDPSPFDDPFGYGRFGAFHQPFIYGRYGRPLFGPGWRYGYWGPGYELPYYEREVALLIRDKRSGDALYEARAHSDGNSAVVTDLLPAMFTATLADFPNGSTTHPHRVRVAPTK